ncbi:MAG TPA: TIGR03620 family F420-dependent LLM class oxidoreductase [Mycobacterium sp.]|nr:TIGR03620 family F420-dependent LLM class oxidoreductase [Mycobacterium sp.]HWT48448.1 TIGR03620 family F420-dependent LLM class oxidoreductase [Mycobacterium sp.]
MATTAAVDAARRALGPVGVSLPAPFTSTPSADLQREAVGRLERIGCQAVWVNEVIGKDALVQLAVLLSATTRMVFGTCIANIWARPAQTMHAAAAQLAQAYPGRFVLGLGVGYPEQAASTDRQFGVPLATMRDYLDRMDSPTWPPAPDATYARVIAANGPKMLALAGETADGAMPAVLPPEFTAQARRVLGPDKLLVVGLSVVVDDDADRAKATAREAVSGRLGVPSYAARMAELGYSAEDIAEVSDRLVDALVAQGDPAAIAAKVREHLAAGADHVTLLLPIGSEFGTGVTQFEQLAPAFAQLG